jgi:hypothetical protein
VFSILLIITLVLIRISVPADPLEAGAGLSGSWKTVNLALNMVPFAGIAYLWFIAVLRDLIGDHEDRFFATVFIGSGLLFLAMLFAASAVAGVFMITTCTLSIRTGIFRRWMAFSATRRSCCFS